MTDTTFAATLLASSLACVVTTIGIYVIARYERWGLGIGFHSLLDGVIYAVTFNVSIFTGFLSAIGMILHEFPEGIVTFLLLDQVGYGKRVSVVFAFLAAAISTPLGTLLVYPFIYSIEQSILGALLAISAGALLYVGASHLLPEVEKAKNRYSIISVAVGVVVAVFIVRFQG